MGMKRSIKEQSIGEIVTHDFRAASVFKDAGIDFCCGGKMTLEAACKEKGISDQEITAKLNALESQTIDLAHNYNAWELGFLCDYIQNTHHKYVLKTLPELEFYTKKIASVHGSSHPELIEIAELFSAINKELLQHLKNEEEVLFPAIKEVEKGNSPKANGIIVSEINRMTAEHEFAGGAMDKINVLAQNYKVPEDGCNSYRVAYKLLKEFEDDLHIHVHLENNILYPKALKNTQ